MARHGFMMACHGLVMTCHGLVMAGHGLVLVSYHSSHYIFHLLSTYPALIPRLISAQERVSSWTGCTPLQHTMSPKESAKIKHEAKAKTNACKLCSTMRSAKSHTLTVLNNLVTCDILSVINAKLLAIDSDLSASALDNLAAQLKKHDDSLFANVSFKSSQKLA